MLKVSEYKKNYEILKAKNIWKFPLNEFPSELDLNNLIIFSLIFVYKKKVFIHSSSLIIVVVAFKIGYIRYYALMP